MENAIRILGIDPGLRRMGWGIVDSDGVRLSYVASGVVRSCAKDDLASRLLQLHDGLSEVVVAHHPLEAAIEETFVNKDARATLKLGQARGVAMLVPAQRNLRVSEYAPNLIKKTITGAGHCEKSQIHAMLKILLPRARPDSDDEADALAIAITHAHHRGVRTAARLAAAGYR